jgi:hypothetical protein
MNPSMVGDTWTGAIEPESSGQHSCAYERVQTCLEAPELDRADVLFNMGWFVVADHGDGETSLAHYLEAARDLIEPDDGGDERIEQFADLALGERNQVRLALGNA